MTLPEIAPDARFADYRDLLGAGVGLRVLPRADGFKTFLVFAEGAQRTDFEFDLASVACAHPSSMDGSVALA